MSVFGNGSAATQDGVHGLRAPEAACYLVDWRMSIERADRACCCPAKPAVVAIMPTTPDRSRAVELLLCRHHYRRGEQLLAMARAAVFDTDGEPLTPGTLGLVETGMQ